MTSPLDVCQQALDQIRVGVTISSINPSDGSNAADIASRNYQPRIDALARAAHWNCMRFQTPLTLVKAARGTPENPSGTTLPLPPAQYLYEYAWPQNPYCLKARYIVPLISQQQGISPPLTTGPILVLPTVSPMSAVPFAVASDTDPVSGNLVQVILTNAQQAILVYTARILDPTIWDSQFLDAAVMTLAAWFCEPITGSTKLQGSKISTAAALVQQARVTDGNEGTTTSDHTPDWIRVRGWGALDLVCGPVAPYDSIGFPGGMIV